jgi:hypothetical protein
VLLSIDIRGLPLCAFGSVATVDEEGTVSCPSTAMGVIDAVAGQVEDLGIGRRASECKSATGLNPAMFTADAAAAAEAAADAAADAADELPATRPMPGSEKPPSNELVSDIVLVQRSLSVSLAADDFELAGDTACCWKDEA